MTNAEKLAKDIELLCEFIADVYCAPIGDGRSCDNCPLKDIKCKDRRSIKKWLEQEAK